MAEGTERQVEIVSVDTSSGIIETMREKYGNKTDRDILVHAFKKRVSSKMDKGHCGTGLWLVNEIVTALKGKLILHTGNYLYRNIQGKISTFESSYWKGTILYVKLPLSSTIGPNLNTILSSNIQYIK